METIPDARRQSMVSGLWTARQPEWQSDGDYTMVDNVKKNHDAAGHTASLGDSHDRPLLIAVSARSLFDLSEETRFLHEHSLDEYRERQRRRRNSPFKPGVAFSFVERMLALNSIEDGSSTTSSSAGNTPLVEVAVLSHMDPDTGVRVMRSIDSLKIPIRMTMFTSGGSLTKYMKAVDTRLYLSMSADSVQEAIDAGVPAGQIVSERPITQHDTGDGEIRLAFDFDGVIGDDSAEKVFQDGGLAAFDEHERSLRDEPIDPGPLAPFIRSLKIIQDAETRRASIDPDYERRLKISVVTSRGTPADVRVMKTMEEWGIELDSAFFLNGHEKRPVIEALHPHLFFDDQPRHVGPVRDIAPAVHVPFGVTNQANSAR